MNVGKSEIMRCHVNGVECMYMKMNGGPLEQVNCCKCMGSQVAADGDVKGMYHTE